MKVVLVHDWLIHMRGGEKVLESIAEIYPDAEIITLFYNRGKLSPSLQKMKIRASWLQKVPGIRKFYRWLLPIFPGTIESFEISEADLVFSSSHCVAKGIRAPQNAQHVCYCHTPMRYLWGYKEDYFRNFSFFLQPLIEWIFSKLKKWDLKTNKAINLFIANSENVRQRIRSFYGREAKVIYPPLDDFFQPEGPKGDYYLVVSAFVPYKRIDLVIEAFNHLSKKLLIVGEGPLDAYYRNLRKNDQISFLGATSRTELRRLYSGAKALIFPTEEDFGIVPLEAQACGTPVIAYGKGGALESVKTGIFFKEQTPESIANAVLAFEKNDLDLRGITDKVMTFRKDCFKKQIQECIQELFRTREPYVVSKE